MSAPTLSNSRSALAPGTDRLFQPVSLGCYTLPHRIVMAPLTRARAARERVPNDLMAEYYAQRASAGLIISEATSISEQPIFSKWTSIRRSCSGAQRWRGDEAGIAPLPVI